MDIQSVVNKLVKQHETRDPFRIAEYLDYIIIRVPLTDIRGYYQRIKRNNIIYLDDSLSDQDARWVCAHELGHSLMHQGTNRIFLDTRTLMLTSRFEIEADRFAVNLLYSDDDLLDYAGFSLPTVADCLGVSCDIAQYRMNGIKQRQMQDYA